MKIKSINILGREYKIVYCKKPSDVDWRGRESLWGQIDYWKRVMRIYENDRSKLDIFETILHETLHSIETDLNLKAFDGDKGHEELEVLALALADTLTRNGLINLEEI